MKPTLRCSELDRRLSCPGSLVLEPLVKQRESDDGTEGTLIHAIVSNELIHAYKAVGDLSFELGTLPLNSHWLVDYCVREIKDAAPDGFSLEVELALAYEFESFSLSGHIDCLALSPDGTEAIGWDWKTGYLPVDSADMNEQVLGYLVLMKRALPQLKKATFKIVQPRNDEDEGFPRISSLTLDNLDNLVSSFETRINESLNRANNLSTGKHCRFCSACLQCPAMKLELETMKASLTPEAIAAITAEPNDAILGDWCVSAKALSGPIDAAKELLYKRLDEKGYVDSAGGVRITQKMENGSYKVPNPTAFYEKLCTIISDPAKRANALSFSMTRIKDTLADTMNIPKTGKKAPVTAEGVFDGAFRPLVEQGQRRKLIYT